MSDIKVRNREIARVKKALSADVSKIPFTMFNTVTSKNAMVLVGGAHNVDSFKSVTVCSVLHMGHTTTTSETTDTENYNFIGDPLIAGLRSLSDMGTASGVKNALVVIATENINVVKLNLTDYIRSFSGSSTAYTHLGEIHSLLTIPLHELHVGVQVINAVKLRRQAWCCEPFTSFKSKMASLRCSTTDDFINEIKRSADDANGRKKSA